MPFHKSLALYDGLSFLSLALGVLGAAFFWMPMVGIALAAVGLVLGFFGWLTASQNADRSAFYLLIGSFFSLASLALNLLIMTGMLGKWV